MNKSTAIERLQRQMESIPDLKQKPLGAPEFKKWHRDTEVAIQRIFGDETRHVSDFNGISYSLAAYSNYTPDSAFVEAYREGLDQAHSILASLVTEIEEYWDEAEHQEAGHPLAVSRLERLFDRFHLVVRAMRDRHNARDTLDVTDEHDVQDLLRALLVIDFEDIRKEEWTPSYAGGSARVDFLIKDEQIVVEVKMARRSMSTKDLGDQLLVDIARYQAHPDCGMLLCFVYDPEGLIGNPVGLERDLTKKHNGLDVRVIVAPRGR